MKVAVAGKGGVGKTTISGTLARGLARAGRSVLALDADRNPMLGVSLGVGAERTDGLAAVRQALEDGLAPHQPTAEGMVEAFGAEAPDGVRLVVASRVERNDPGCICCGVSPEQLLVELEATRRAIVCDMEAGVGTVSRLRPGQADVVLVVADPSAKGIDVARRAARIAAGRARVLVVANRIGDEGGLGAIRAALGDFEIAVVPEDPAIAAADRAGAAPIDVAPDGAGVRAILDLADRLGPGVGQDGERAAVDEGGRATNSR